MRAVTFLLHNVMSPHLPARIALTSPATMFCYSPETSPCHSHSLRAVLCSTGNRGTVSRAPHSGLAMRARKAETDPRERIPI